MYFLLATCNQDQNDVRNPTPNDGFGGVHLVNVVNLVLGCTWSMWSTWPCHLGSFLKLFWQKKGWNCFRKISQRFKQVGHKKRILHFLFHQSTQLALSCSKTTLFTPYPKSLWGKPRWEVDGGFGPPAGNQRATSGPPAGHLRAQGWDSPMYSTLCRNWEF